mmetsp:Transcript_37499/g.54872  ORF Transcript_37499/g.54872 Transcript_37499/m.54872 type:complete len:92 (+) Transcript_37499:339-614(+)
MMRKKRVPLSITVAPIFIPPHPTPPPSTNTPSHLVNNANKQQHAPDTNLETILLLLLHYLEIVIFVVVFHRWLWSLSILLSAFNAFLGISS